MDLRSPCDDGCRRGAESSAYHSEKRWTDVCLIVVVDLCTAESVESILV